MTNGLTETGQEYFDRQEGDPYIIRDENDSGITIDIRPGLVTKTILAGVALEKGKPATHEQITVTPEEAANILRQKMGDVLSLNE